MRLSKSFFSLVLFLFLSYTSAVVSSFNLGSRGCRCLPTDPCWPSEHEWDKFNETVNGRLVHVRPVGSVCHGPDFNQASCSLVQASANSSLWRISQPGALQFTTWESKLGGNSNCPLKPSSDTLCKQGLIPVYAVMAESAEDIQSAVRFAKHRNLRVAVRSTGHNTMGKSGAFGALQINVSRLKQIEPVHDFIPQGGDRSEGQAVTIGTGVIGMELAAAGAKNGFTAVIGTCSSVGAAGGFLQGGGASFLGPAYGTASDNALEFNVVTAQGELIVANKYQNQDIFWALRGGGGGTFGVVVTATIRTFPDVPAVHFSLTAFIGRQNGTVDANRIIWDITTQIVEVLPALKERDNATSAQIIPQFYETSADLEAEILFINTADAISVTKRLSPLYSALQKRGLTSFYASNETFYPRLSTFLSQPRTLNKSGYGIIEGNVLVSENLFLSPNGTREIIDMMSHLEYKMGDTVEFFMSGGGRIKANKNIVESALLPSWRDSPLMLTLRRVLPPDSMTTRMADSQLPVLRSLESPSPGSYLNFADSEEPDFQRAFWGDNYARLYEIKRKWDPHGLFIVRLGVGSEDWDDLGICPTGSRY